MNWQRRRLLQLVGATGVSTLAGCGSTKSDPKTDSQPEFGSSVAVSGDGTTALVGAPREAGSAYVFAANGGGWIQQAKLTAAGGEQNDYFGYSMAVSGDGTTAIIGAPREAGSAYVFAANGGDWIQQAKLIADDGDKDVWFGSSVAVSGDGTTAIIGAPKEAGSAYVFEASGSDWAQQAKPTAEDGDTDDQFGYSVAVSGDGTTALIGAPHDEAAGSVYVFAATGGGWTQQAKLTTDNSS